MVKWMLHRLKPHVELVFCIELTLTLDLGNNSPMILLLNILPDYLICNAAAGCSRYIPYPQMTTPYCRWRLGKRCSDKWEFFHSISEPAGWLSTPDGGESKKCCVSMMIRCHSSQSCHIQAKDGSLFPPERKLFSWVMGLPPAKITTMIYGKILFPHIWTTYINTNNPFIGWEYFRSKTIPAFV